MCGRKEVIQFRAGSSDLLKGLFLARLVPNLNKSYRHILAAKCEALYTRTQGIFYLTVRFIKNTFFSYSWVSQN